MFDRISKSVTVIAVASLLVGAMVAGPADAKKKKKKKKPVVPVCAPYVPGTNGADVPVTLVTDAATADAPVTLELDTAQGLGIGRDASSPEGEHVSQSFTNVQVDSANPSTGLFSRIEFNEAYDYDLYMDTADGTNVALSAGSPLFSDGDLRSTTDNDSTSGPGSEQINGLPVTDCDGYTFDVAGATTPGDTVTLKLWLAPPEAVPAK